LALKSGLDEADASMIAAASPMHDIGKVGIPDAILLKPAALDQDEWCIMQTHAMLGFNILSHSQRPLLKAAAIIAKEHHEKWNGSGYPEGLAGEKIHPYARIVAIADIFDALGHSRPYKKAWSDKKILDFFQEEAGKQFDPFLVQIFIDSFDTFVAIREALKS
jgi:response regulator RpfG family c-di-GMP phosphodiesterase